ncbi:head maturation protease, ClpP-related [Actinomyces radicidentis]|uniref:head maturation protease, ClpP-related n=1 Tax=Actinomyces radicidentis TaxID=111015 RepID=UPI0028EABCCD|nr:head maturation protease, ClpP-related [Actinomyces radicidentis]
MKHPQPTRTFPWARIDMRAQDTTDSAPTTADVLIYDAIGADPWGDGISPKELAAQIADLDVDQLNVYINSPGGAAWDGLAIMNTLRRHRATVNVTVDALAASAASVIAMAGDHVTMNRGAELMIHDASGFAMGNAATMRETADVLDKLSDSYADAYAARAGGDRVTWREVMQAETWFTAEEAVAAGLADEWVDAPSTEAHFDRSGFRYEARAAAPAPAITHPLPASEPGDHTTTNRKELAMSDTLSEGLRQRLGLADSDVDDSTILATLDESLAASAAAEAPTIPAGTALIDEGVLAELRADAAAGREAKATLESDRRDAIVDKAIAEGRIAPASRASWRDMCDVDEEGTKTLLASLEANTIPVAEVGIGLNQDVDEDTKIMRIAGWASAETDKENR